MTDNEKKFVESIVNFSANIKKAQSYIKENYGVNSVFDMTNGLMHLQQTNDALMTAAAKNYISENFEEITCFVGESKVFVVKDKDNGDIVGVFNTQEDAEAAKKEYEVTPDMKAEISTEDSSDFIKE